MTKIHQVTMEMQHWTKAPTREVANATVYNPWCLLQHLHLQTKTKKDILALKKSIYIKLRFIILHCLTKGPIASYTVPLRAIYKVPHKARNK